MSVVCAPGASQKIVHPLARSTRSMAGGACSSNAITRGCTMAWPACLSAARRLYLSLKCTDSTCESGFSPQRRQPSINEGDRRQAEGVLDRHEPSASLRADHPVHREGHLGELIDVDRHGAGATTKRPGLPGTPARQQMVKPNFCVVALRHCGECEHLSVPVFTPQPAQVEPTVLLSPPPKLTTPAGAGDHEPPDRHHSHQQ